MARLFQTGFGIGSFAATGPTSSPDAQWWDNAAADTTVPRTGAQCLKLINQSSWIYTFAAATTRTIYVRFAFRKSGNPAIASKLVGTSNLNADDTPGTIWLNTNGTLELRNSSGVRVGSASSVLSNDVWYVIEVQSVTTPTCSMAFRIDGASIASGATSGAPFSTDQFVIMNAIGTANTVFIDDFALNDSTGSVNNTWIGNGKVALLDPISDNTVTNFTGGSAGTTNLWDAVNNTPPTGFDNTAPGQWSNTSQIKCNSSSTGSLYRANLTTYTSAGVTAPINAIVGWVCHAEEIATGTKTGAISLTANPVVAGVTFNYGDDLGVIGDYPTGWRWKSVLSESPSVTLGSSPVLQITKTDATTRVAHACRMGLYVDYATSFLTLLVVQDAAHAHPVGNIALTQANTVSVSSPSHAHAAQGLTLPTSVTLTVQSAVKAHSADSVSLSVPSTSAQRQYQLPGYQFINETGTRQYQLPGGPFINETAPSASVGVDLIVQNTAHGHTAQNVILGQANVLVVNGALHGHTAQSNALTQANALAVQGTAHAHTAQNVALSQATTLSVQGTIHAHAAQNVSLVQANTLTVQGTIHAHATQNVSLVQANVLAVQGSTHAHTAQNILLSQAIGLNVQSTLHAHTAQNVSLVQANTLAVQGTIHSHTAQSFALTQKNTLAVQGAVHSHTAQNISLTQAIAIAVQNATHAHSSSNILLQQANTLALQNALHAHTAQNIALKQANTLAVNGSLHAHSVQNVNLTQATTLSVGSTRHIHTVQGVVLVQANVLSMRNAAHGHTAQNVSLAQQNTLVVSGTVHAHTVTSPLLNIFFTLNVSSSKHTHTASSVELYQESVLGHVNNAFHAHTAGNVLLSQANFLTLEDAYHAHYAESPVTDITVVLLPANCLHGHRAEHVSLRFARMVEFLAAAGQTLSAKLFEVTSGAVADEASSVVASLNRQMMYQATFDAAEEKLYQLVVYASGSPIAHWYVAIRPSVNNVYRSGNYADIIMSESIELMKAIALNKTVTDPVTGVMTIYADDSVTPMLTTQMYEDVTEEQTYRGRGAEVRGRLT